MGRRKPYVAQELTFAPKISRTSKRIALRLSEHLDTKGVPRFMQATKSKKLTLEPITSVPITNRSSNEDQSSQISLSDAAVEHAHLPSRPVLPSLTPDGTGGGGVNRTSSKNATTVSSFVGCANQEDVKTVDPFNNAMSKNAYLPPRALQLDENVFTFRPKVSSASAKIAESLGTDFMSRQQMHLEKQKRLLEQSSQQVRFPTHLVAQALRRRDVREFGDFNNNALPADSMAAATDALNMVGNSEEATGRDTYSSDNMRDPSHSAVLGGGKGNDDEASSSGLQRLLSGPYAASAANLVLKKKKLRQTWFSDSDTLPRRKHSSSPGFPRDGELAETLTRSKTMPTLGRPKLNRKLSTFNDGERLHKAKEMVEKAIKYRKVFTIQGGYSSIRHSLRRRGWVEKFYKIPTPPKKTPRTKRRKTASDDDDDDNDDDDDDDDDDDTDDDDNDEPKIPPWEEEDGVYGIMGDHDDCIYMSRMLRNTNPSFFWVLKRDVIDYRFLNRDQVVNHYCKAGSFTTKVGLCVNMKNVPWFEDADPDQFFPRCYRLSHDEDKQAFIDDFRQTACRNILKMAVNQDLDGPAQDSYEAEQAAAAASSTKIEPTPSSSASANTDAGSKNETCTNPDCTRSRPNTTSENKCICSQKPETQQSDGEAASAPATDTGEAEGKTAEKTADEGSASQPAAPETSKYPRVNRPSATEKRRKKRVLVPLRVLEMAILQCELYLAEREHEDIDKPEETSALTDAQWDDLIHWYYQLAHEDGVVVSMSATILDQVESLINRLKTHLPQFEMDGIKNVWIVKPGAKSRGRGITCYNRLDDMLKLVNATVVKKDGKYVVQKYMERPLLIYNTKFDIRQWFLVTDWNPLTLWFYQDSYLRFCSQQYTLDDFNQAIHLSNNAIQKYCKNGPRSSRLPTENMWTHEEFKDYLKSRKHPNAWEDIIYPGMKKAIICALLCTQDLVEYRKSSFELYGADFMLTEDLQPWLIEINSSPSMEASTAITARLCHSVLDDTIKVVVDRRCDKNCDVGAFELAYKQPLVTVPPYIGISLCVEGQAIKRPGMPFVRNPADVLPRRSNDYNPMDVYGRRNMANSSDSHLTDVLFTPRPPLRALHSEKHSDGALKKTPSGTGVTSLSSTNCPNSTRKDDDTPDNGSVISCPPKTTGASHSETSSTAVNVDGKSTSRYRVSSEGGSKTDRGEQNKIGSELKMPNTQNFPPSSVVYSQHTPLLIDSGNKRIISKTSVCSNYTIPGSQNSNGASRSLVVNNVESTDLKSFKPTKGRVSMLMEGAWGRTCSECGSGMNLRLQVSNPHCRCQLDSLVVADLDHSAPAHISRAMPVRNNHLRPRSARGRTHSPCATTTANNHSSLSNSNTVDGAARTPHISRPLSPRTSRALSPRTSWPLSPRISGSPSPSANPSPGQGMIGCYTSSGRFSPGMSYMGDKLTFQYSQAATCYPPSMPPHIMTPLVANPLPKMVRRFYGKKDRSAKNHVSMSVSLSAGMGVKGSQGPHWASGAARGRLTFLHTSSSNTPLSIMPQGYPR